MSTSDELVLVVDDVPENRDILERRLKRQGYSVRTAEDGRQAMEMLRATKFDLMLLDIMMPEMNGFEVLEKLNEDDELRRVPVIVISALEDIASTVRCIEMGADDYLTKPFNPTILMARVNSSLSKKRMRDRERDHLKQIEDERNRADGLLRVILPDKIADELMSTNAVKPRRYENAVVLFADVVDFTSYCDSRDPSEVLHHLQALVQAFESLVLDHGLLKMKTVGDSFMASAGLLDSSDEPVSSSIRCGLDMISTCQGLPAGWNLRVGLHRGPVIAGVVGHRQYLFDVWGDTVNTAARVEQNGTAGAVNASRQAWKEAADEFKWESSTQVDVKGKGPLEIFHTIPNSN